MAVLVLLAFVDHMNNMKVEESLNFDLLNIAGFTVTGMIQAFKSSQKKIYNKSSATELKINVLIIENRV